VIGPLVAPLGSTVQSCTSEITWNEAAAPLKFTAVVPVKLVPERVTVVPAGRRWE